MGLTESARHLPPLGTEEALRPDPAECRHVFDSDTAPCHFDGGVRYRLRSRRIVARLWETAWPARGLEEPPVRKRGNRYVIRKADRSRRMLRRSPESEGWVVRRVMTCDPEPPPQTSP